MPVPTPLAGPTLSDEAAVRRTGGSLVESVARTDAAEVRLELPPETATALADRRWAYQEYSAGNLDAYRGGYVAVHERKVVGHGSRSAEVRERVSRETGIPASRLVVVFVNRQIA